MTAFPARRRVFAPTNSGGLFRYWTAMKTRRALAAQSDGLAHRIASVRRRLGLSQRAQSELRPPAVEVLSWALPLSSKGIGPDAHHTGFGDRSPFPMRDPI